ncbi:protein LDOC1-like [Protobothrops mucrosquamatus]|uniref:protein LDOC1-like n=1 Tax=Protobothrops mucrosquamatus TaxID=103944 RepID=UPI0010FB42C6|nr:protein LDOC1-like [Protobothrops mucrosquamatus]
MDQLYAENDQLKQQVALLTAQMAQMQAARPRHRSPVTVPEKFDGSQARFPSFFGQCQLCMSLWPEDFPTDRDKVGFVISLLTGTAARWATPLLTQPNQLLDNYAEF